MAPIDHSESRKKDLTREIVDNENRLNTLHGLIARLDSEEAEADKELHRSIKNVSKIYDAWRGPEAKRYVDQTINEYENTLKTLHRDAGRIREDMREEASDLKRKQEYLHEDLDRMEREDDIQDGETD